MAARKPQTKEEMLEVNGVGEVKYERYGEEFLVLLRER
jgi:ATP-dependent DNA helicase RecQ